MAVLGRVLFASAERVDLPDLLSIDSYTISDFKYLIQSFVGEDTPYILKGFDVADPQNSIGTQTISINVADSIAYFPGSSAGPFFYGLPAGNPNSAPLIPELRTNATNYVYLTFTTFDAAQDNRAFWDPDMNGGAGGEFSQNVNTESVLSVNVGVSVAGFPDGTIPVCSVVVGPSVITSIEDCRNMMFRLGTGGLAPNPFNRYQWPSAPSSAYAREEPPTTMTSPLSPNPFQGGDKNFTSLKDWMDAVMTKILEIGGTNYWYEDTSSYNLIQMFLDTMASTFKSKGQWVYNGSTPGLITWTDDIVYKRLSDPRDIIIRAGSSTLANEQVLYLVQEDSEDINTGSVQVSWVNGSTFVNGQVGAFENVSQGDWIKQAGDPTYMYLRVEQFYATQNGGGGPTSPNLAQSVLLSGQYQGPTQTAPGVYTKGVYQTTDLQVGTRSQAAMLSAGGNFLWLADRSDTVMSIASITSTTINCNITTADGTEATITATGHGLVTGDYVTLTNSTVTGYNGTWQVDVVDANTFTIQTTTTGTATATGYYALVTTQASTNGYGMQLESADHGFSSQDEIIISGTSSGYDSASPYAISVRSTTTFTIPISSNIGTVNAGTATLSRANVRSEFGLTKIVQGESVNIGADDTTNLKSFVGMTSDDQTFPAYELPTGYNTLVGQQNYNGSATDSLVTRVAELTAMMADKAQDKTIQLLPSGFERILNVTSGSNQDVSFVSLFSGTPRLDVGLPHGVNSGYVGLSNTLQLGANQAAYFTIDRNNNFSIADLTGLTVSSITTVPLTENTFIFAYRLTGTDIWLWDGRRISASVSANLTEQEAQRLQKQDRTGQLIGGGDWSWTYSSTTLTWASAAYVRLPGLADAVNTIAAGSVVLPASDSIAYVTLNRQGSGGSLSVTVATIESLTESVLTDDMFIIARRDGNNVVVNDMLLIDGESRVLGASMSEQTKTLLGTSVTQADSNPNYSGRGAPDRVVRDSDGALDAITNIDIELNKWFGQLQLRAMSPNSTRVQVTGSDWVMRDDTTISKEIQSLLLEFTGAQIDFSTGNVYASDGVTPLGINFTPTTLASGQWLWYSVTLVPSAATTDNRLTGQLVVIPATTSGSSQASAPRAAFASGTKIGQVAVQSTGSSVAAISQSNIVQLNMNDDGEGGVGLKNYIKNPEVDYATINWSVVGNGLTITKTTATNEILEGAGSLKITGSPATVGAYVEGDMIPIDYEDMGNLMYVYFTYRTEGPYNSGDMEVVIADLVGNTTTVVGTIPASTTPTFFQSTYQLNSNISHNSYQLRVQAVNATSGSLVMDDIFFGPQIGVTAMPQTLVGDKTFTNSLGIGATAAPGSARLTIGVNTDTTPVGGINFGGDTTLYRSASDTLTTGGNLVIGGTLTLDPMTQGSILFIGPNGLVKQDNTQLYWDDTNLTLAINNGASSSWSIHSNGTQPGLIVKTPNSADWVSALFDNNGNVDNFVLINNPSQTVQISSWQAYGMRIGVRGQGSGQGKIFFTTGSDNVMAVMNGNTLGIGANFNSTTLVPQSTLDVAGNMVVGTGYAGVSSAPTNGLLVQGQVGLGTTSVASNTALEVSLSNGSVSDGGTNSHIFLNNPSNTGQTQITSVIGSTTVAKWRTDYAGNINWVAYAGDHDFFTGGDSGTGSIKLAIKNNGNIALGAGASTSSLVNIGTNTTAASSGVLFGTDTNLYRSASSTLRTDGILQIGNYLSLMGSTSGSVSLIASATTAPYTLTMPNAQGPAYGAMVDDGNGNLTWYTGVNQYTSATQYYSTGADSYSEYINGPGDTSGVAGLVSFATATTVTSVSFVVQGPPANIGNLTGYIYANNSGIPGTVLATSTNTISTGSLSSSSYQTITFNFSGFTASANTSYWYGFSLPGYSGGGNFIYVQVTSGGTGAMYNQYNPPYWNGTNCPVMTIGYAGAGNFWIRPNSQGYLDNSFLNYAIEFPSVGIGAAASSYLLQVGTNTTTAVGGISFGTDTDLYRSGTNSLKTDGSFTAGSFAISGMTSGSVIFVNSSGNLAQDNSKLFWDDTNHRLGIGTTSPSRDIDVQASGLVIIGTGSNSELMLREADGTVRTVGAFHWSIRTDIGGNNNDLKLVRFVAGSFSDIPLQVSNTTGQIYVGPGQSSSSAPTYTSVLNIGQNTTSNTGGITFWTDTNLYRSTASTLKTDGNLVIGSNLTLSTFTQNSILFVGASGQVAQDNANFYWNDSTYQLWIGLPNGGVGTYMYGHGNAIGTVYDAGGAPVLQVGGNTSEAVIGTNSFNGGSLKLKYNMTINSFSTGSGSTAIEIHSSGLTEIHTTAAFDSQVGFGTTSPGAQLDVVNKFQVNSSGNLIKVNNVTYNWPSAQGATRSYLENDGSGNLSWVTSEVWTTETSAYTASNGDRILADTSNGAFTITLPPSPTVGMNVLVMDAAGTFSTNNLTVSGNGANINSSSGNFVMDTNNTWVEFVYYNSTRGWIVRA